VGESVCHSESRDHRCLQARSPHEPADPGEVAVPRQAPRNAGQHILDETENRRQIRTRYPASDILIVAIGAIADIARASTEDRF
jgi:hypothetical protein